MSPQPPLAIVELSDQRAWEQWLQENHESSPGVWLKIAKKGAPRATVSYAEAVESGLCFGWIDGQKQAHDEWFYLQRFTRRGPRSKWSQINRDSVTELFARGRLRPAGIAEMQRAQADGRWEAAYPSQRAATVSEDFQLALDAHPEAKAFFETLTGSNRYAFLYRLHNVKRPEARAKRIAEYITLLSEHKTLLR
jgi:uncharacterized protein YdeI (YjbR/CyaY-like superfamily)